MSIKPTVKEIVKDNEVYFSHYKAGHLYYNVDVDGKTYMFPVPIEDIGDATFEARDRAMLFMRYVKKALEIGSFIYVKDVE